MMTASRSLWLVAIAMIAAEMTVAVDSGPAAVDERALFTFDVPGSVAPWTPVNDTVMGGVSSGRCGWSEAGALEFSGTVSLENNGGFASIRVATDSLDVSAYEGIMLRVRGDGKRYSLSIQTDYRIVAGAYYFTFQAEPGVWQEVVTPMSALQARSFGRALPSAPPLNTRDIRSLGFIISDKQEGPFRLEVDWIKVGNKRADESPLGDLVEQDPAKPVTALIQEAINRGAPLFNAGRPEACAAVYEMTARCIVDLSAGRLPPEVVRTLRSGLAKAARSTDPAERAWAMRYAFDTSLEMLERE
jgi:monofunctional biosynthetic peptidoglycan transglycosylase